MGLVYGRASDRQLLACSIQHSLIYRCNDPARLCLDSGQLPYNVPTASHPTFQFVPLLNLTSNNDTYVLVVFPCVKGTGYVQTLNPDLPDVAGMMRLLPLHLAQLERVRVRVRFQVLP